MKKALFITLKEIRDFLEDKSDLAFSLLLPVIIFALMYGAFGGNTQFNGTSYIVNKDSGQYSALLIERLGQYKGLSIEVLNSEEADKKLDRSDVRMVLEIPAGFSENLAAGQSAQLIFKQRGNGGTEGQITASLIRGVVEGINQEIQVKKQVRSTLSSSNIDPGRIDITVQKFLNREETNPVVNIKETLLGDSPDPVNQFLPGILTMFVLFSISLTAQSLVEERRNGTLERLLTTRLKIGELFLGKFLAYVGRGFIQTIILLVLAELVFGLFTAESFLLALILALIFAAAASTLGLIIGSLSKTHDQAIWISVFFTMAMVMLSGTFMAISKGTTLYTLSRFSINTYANEAFRSIINHSSLADVSVQIFVMLGVAVVGLLASRMLFRVSQGGK
jgi:ABC-2 type transport system permease protein